MPACDACRDQLCAACSGYTALPVRRTCSCYDEHADADPHRHPLTAAAANARIIEACQALGEHRLTSAGGFRVCTSCRAVVTPQDPVTARTA